MALPSHLFRKYRWFSTIAVYTYVLSILSTDSVKLTIEKPKIQQTTAELDILGIETFDGLKAGGYEVYETSFGNSSYKGVYHNLRLQARDYSGGAGGKGFYPVVNEGSGYRLVITQDEQAEMNYFGLWISTFEFDNSLEFFYKGSRIYVLNPKDVYELMKGNHHYLGNPTYWFLPLTDPYVFVNFFFNYMNYDEVRFSDQVRRFGSDNHSVGHCTIKPDEVTPVSTILTVLAAGLILFLVGAGILVFYCCLRQSSAAPSLDAAAKSREATKNLTDREEKVSVGGWVFA